MKNTTLAAHPRFQAGIARQIITPPFHVELAGLGYYLKRTPERVRDDLTATSLVVTGSDGKSIAIVALDLMYISEQFVRTIRDQVTARTDISADAICVNCSHSHNAPTAAMIRGGGEMDTDYVQFAAKTAAETVIEAWRLRQPAKLYTGSAEVKGYTFNRTRENGPVDTHLSLLRVETLEGKPLAAMVNFHSHLTAHQDIDWRAVSRDWSGEVTDQIEAVLPGLTGMYVQGTCGDVMLSPEFNSTARRFEPARAIAKAALEAWSAARLLDRGEVRWATHRIQLPTRRWTREEINRDREEALYRLKTGDTKGWREGFARVIVTYPDRLPSRYGGSVEQAVAAVSRFGVEWTDAMLPSLDTRPEFLETEVQAIRLDDAWIVAHGAELFSTLGLEVRRRKPCGELFILGYSNGSIGYLPDAFDVERRSYAADQSPKFKGQFPFTAQSGKVMVDALLGMMQALNSPKLA